MASVRKRSWKTASGEAKAAWVDSIDADNVRAKVSEQRRRHRSRTNSNKLDDANARERPHNMQSSLHSIRRSEHAKREQRYSAQNCRRTKSRRNDGVPSRQKLFGSGVHRQRCCPAQVHHRHAEHERH